LINYHKAKNMKFTFSLFVISALAILVGCNGSGTGSNATIGRNNVIISSQPCLLDMPLSGEITEDLNWTINQGCGGTSLQNDMIVVSFGGFSTTFNVRITINDIVKQETSVNKTASVFLRYVSDGREWETDATACTVNISENRENNTGINSYWIAGSGSCDSDALPYTGTGATDPITIDNFSFRSSIAWP
jgi:hypothetical protein